MSAIDAWNRMSSSVQENVTKLVYQYYSTGSSDILRQLKKIFENYGDDDPVIEEIKLVLKRR